MYRENWGRGDGVTGGLGSQEKEKILKAGRRVVHVKPVRFAYQGFLEFGSRCPKRGGWVLSSGVSSDMLWILLAA